MKYPSSKPMWSRLLFPCLLVMIHVFILLRERTAAEIPPMDDVYIHLVYGRSLISGNPLVYTGGDGATTGFTSPLWLPAAAISSQAGTTAAPSLLMFASLLAAATLLYLAGPIPAMLLFLTGPFVFHAASGMETSLACLVLFLAWRWMEENGTPRSGGLILLAAFLSRPELALLAIPMSLSLKRITPGNVAALLAPSAVAGIIWVFFNLSVTGRPLPSTFYAKIYTSWPEAAKIGFPGLLKSMFLTSPLLPFATLFAAAYTWKDRKRGGVKRLAPALTPLVLFLAALSMQPNGYFQLRYYVPFLVSSVLLVARRLENSIKDRKRRILSTAILAASMVPGFLVFTGRRIDASRDVMYIDVMPAKLIESIADQDAVVAAADIGAVGWISGTGILDLDGLVTPERLNGENAGWKWIRERADYLLAFPEQYSDLTDEAGESIDFIGGYRSPTPVICGEDTVALWKIERLDN